jgi:hypothetical protein
MQGSQCDTCRMFVTSFQPGWMTLNKVMVVENPPYAPCEAMQTIGTFCSVKCLTEYSYFILATETV